MGAYRSFRDDDEIGKKLDSIPKNERSTIIRMALRQYFGITPGKPVEPITPDIAHDAARLVAKELMRGIKAERTNQGGANYVR